MANRIVEQTKAFLAKLKAQSREMHDRAARAAAEHSRTIYGVELSLAEEAYLAIAVKFVIAVDGLSPDEAIGLRRLMQRYQPPEEFLAFVEGFNTNSVTLDEIADLFEAGSIKARRVLSGAIFVAGLDGMTDLERQTALRIADRLGLSPALVDVYEARTRLDLLAFRRNDPELLEAVTGLRNALWKLS